MEIPQHDADGIHHGRRHLNVGPENMLFQRDNHLIQLAGPEHQRQPSQELRHIF